MPSYPANEKNYHHWRAIDVERGSVVLNVLVHPRNPRKLGTWVFSIEVVKPKSRWLVNRIYTIAVMNPPVRPSTVTHELGPADYAAPPPTSRTSTTSSPSSHSFLLPVVGIFAIVLLIPAGARRRRAPARAPLAEDGAGRRPDGAAAPPLELSRRVGRTERTRVGDLTFSLLPWSTRV